MGESVGIDSFFGIGAMPKAYSANIRGRVIARIEGGATRREAAEHFEVSANTGQMDEVLSRDGKLCGQAARGQHLAAGGARGLLAYADCRAAGFDAG